MPDGGVGELTDEEGAADMVAEGLALSSDLERLSPNLGSDEDGLGEGVDAAVSAMDAGASVIFTS